MLALHMQGPGFAPQALKTSFLSLAQKFSMSSHPLGIKDLSTTSTPLAQHCSKVPALSLQFLLPATSSSRGLTLLLSSLLPSEFFSSYFFRLPYFNSTLSPCLNFLQNLNYLRNYTFTSVCLSSLECNLNNVPVDPQFLVNSRHSRLALEHAGCSSWEGV